MDFAITSSGDLILEEFNELKKFKLSFRMSENKGFNLRFSTPNQLDYIEKKQFKLSFTNKKTSSNTYKASSVDSVQEKAQQIRIALTTERGELLKRIRVGSKLYMIKHENLHDSQNLRLIEDITKEALKDILNENITIMAKPEKSTGNFYCSNISVYIYYENHLIFKFYI